MGCDSADPARDASTATDAASETTDATSANETLDETSEDAVEDVAPDAIEDTVEDVAPDIIEDTVDDVAPDTIEDIAPDTIEDVAPDTIEETVEDTSSPDVDPNDPFAGLSAAALREALRVLTTTGHTPLGYNGARDRMYAEGGIDDHAGRIECVYTGRSVDTDGSRTPGDNCRLASGAATTCQFNTEHTFARHWLDEHLTEGSTAYNAAESDIHQLHPTEEVVNNRRWHFDFGDTTCGETSTCKVDELSQLGLRPGLVGGNAQCPTGNLDLDHVCVMRVRAERRGDIARGMLYMAVRYTMPLDDEMEAALRGWNLSDPPDERERQRNDGIEAAQHNRNPFVDRPDLVERISDF